MLAAILAEYVNIFLIRSSGDIWGYSSLSSIAGSQGLAGVYYSYISTATDRLQGKKAATEAGAL